MPSPAPRLCRSARQKMQRAVRGSRCEKSMALIVTTENCNREQPYGELMNDAGAYDPRYLAGILFFNRGDFFEAHEAWESLWMDTAGPDKTFYQGLIQAA